MKYRLLLIIIDQNGHRDMFARHQPFLFGFGWLGAGLAAKSKLKFLVTRGDFRRDGRGAGLRIQLSSSSSIIIRSLSSTSLGKGVDLSDSGCNFGAEKGDGVRRLLRWRKGRVVTGSDDFKFMTLKAGKAFTQHSYLGSSL